jgi:subtilase family serine protease
MKEEVYKRVLKLVSAIVVLNLAFGGFIGLMLLEEEGTVEADVTLPMPDANNVVVQNADLFIDGSTLPDNTLDIDANFRVTNNRRCTLVNTKLVFQVDTTHRWTFQVDGGGILELINSTITVETSDGGGALIDNYEWLNWFNSTNDAKARFRRMVPFNMNIIGPNSKLYLSEGSSLEWEGELSFSAGANGTIRDSVITSPSAPFSTYDWGIVVHIDDVTNPLSPVIFEDSRVEKSPWFQGVAYVDPDDDGGNPSNTYVMYENHTIVNSYVHVINTYWDLDFQNRTSPTLNANLPLNNNDQVNHYPWFINPNKNAMEISAGSTVNFYGLTIDMDETSGLIPTNGYTAVDVLDAGSDVTIYRWLAVSPVDNTSVPLNGVTVEITTIKGGALGLIIDGLNDASYCWPAWEYINRLTDGAYSDLGAVIQGVTGVSGRVVFPLASDKITQTGWPNSDQFPDGYNIDATNPAPLETVEGLVDFKNFPRLFPEDNFVDYIMPAFSFGAPHPELYPKFSVLPPTSELENVNVNITVDVWNAIVGAGQTANNIMVQFWDGDPTLNTSTKIGEQIISSLAAGANETVWVNWLAAPAGTHSIYIGVDRNWDKPILDNLIPEPDETNNVVIATITVLERSDLFINGSFIYFSPGNKVVNGTAVKINAVIQNIGGSTATDVVVNFYDGTSGGSGAFIGSTTVTVTAGSSTLASWQGWGPDVGLHYVWVKIDEPIPTGGSILEKDELNNVASQSIEVQSRPDLEPGINFNPSSPQFEGTVITIQAQIGNSGGSNVTSPVTVYFYKDDLGNKIGEAIIPVDFQGISILGGGGEQTVSITWTAEYPPNDHTFFVVVDPDDLVDESDETDNTVSDIFTVNPRPNLEIVSADIDISDPYPMELANVNIDVTVRNTGLSSFTDAFYVRIWLDEVGTGTMLTEIMVPNGVGSGSSVPVSYAWNGVTPPGRHDVWVVLDYNNTIAETSETDNSAAATIVIFKVPSDLIVNDSTIYPPYPAGLLILEDYWDSSDPYIRDGYTLVEESGTLIIRNSIFEVVGQSKDLEYNIVVKDSGTLIIDEDSFITTEQYVVNIYLFDDAELYIDGSTIDNKVNIIAEGNSEIYITEQSAIYGNIVANEASSTVYLNIVNSSLTNKLDNIGGGTFAELWGVFIAGEPASDDVITVSDSALVYIEWFLTVNVVDINNEAIEGADVMWYRSPPWKDTDSQVTDASGVAFFRVRGMNITAAAVVEDIGSYKVVADFTSPYTLLTYYPDANVTTEMTRNKVKTIKFSSVMPDLDPPLFVTYPGSTLSVGDTATIITWINNTGASAAVNVFVQFDDDTNEGGWPKLVMNQSIGPGESWYIEVEWIPTVIGWHNISVFVDPSNLIIESNESNNFNSIPAYVTPQKADLTLSSGDIGFTFPSTGPTENDTITIQTTIRNIGETNAFPSPELTVQYWLGTAIAPTVMLGWGNISGVTAGSTTVSSYVWNTATPPGIYYIWVIVDPDLLVEETNDLNNSAYNSIYIKEYADITPVGLEFLVNEIAVTTIPDTTTITLRATVQNMGETDAENVKVQFFDGDPSAGGIQIGDTQTIALIVANAGSGQAEVDWIATVVGNSQVHKIYVRVSGVEENIKDNNEYSRDLTVTLRPILTVTDIDFSDNSPFEGESFQIFALVKNTGGTPTTTFSIGFYDDDPNFGGNQIGAETLSLNINTTGIVNVSWSPTPGSHEIFVVADSNDDIDEADETNNIASEVIVVYSSQDIIVNNANTPQSLGTIGSPEPLAPQHRGYTLVEEEGVFTLTYTTFQVLETHDHQFNMIVRDNGTLIIESGSTLFTNGPLMRIYLYDNATLIIKDSVITSSVIDIMAFGNSEIIIDESQVNSFIRADAPTANVQLSATNSSLTQAFTFFGGSSSAVFKNVTSPSVQLSSNAELTVYQWLMVIVEDGAGTGIMGADVSVSTLIGVKVEIPDSPKVTGENGLALFGVLTDVITATSETSSLTYSIDAEYIYDTINYTGDSSVTFTSYVDDKDTNYKVIVISLSDLKPDLFVNTTSIQFFADAVERNTVGVGEPITITAKVWNVGTAGTTASTQVIVRFYHKLRTGVFRYLGEDIITTPMAAAGGEGTATISWTPQDDERGDNEEIWIIVDPDNLVAELQESQDNTNFNTVNIIRPPDLDVVSITFNTDDFSDIDNTTETEIVEIVTVISNIGTDNPAISIDVMCFDGFPDFDGDMRPDSPLPTGVEQIGSEIISSLAPGTSQTITFDPSWDTTGKEKGHSIYVYALDATTIGDQILTNNNASESFVVIPKPDLRPEILPPITEYITLVGSDGNILSGNPQIGQTIKLQATIFNFGQAYIYNANVSFWIGDPQGSGVQIGSDTQIQITPNSPMNASVSWNVQGPGGSAGDVEIYVWVNANQKIIESEYDNNIESTTFTVAYADVLFDFTEDLKDSYSTEGTLIIRARVTFTDTEGGVANLPFTLRIRNAANDAEYGNAVTGVTDLNGNVIRDLPVPTVGGNYYVEIQLDYGGIITARSSNFEITEEEKPFLPFEWIILIIIIAVLVVVLAGVALAKLGLGRLVECGECGAFIPEGEKKCPKCGAVFESDTAKCSECGGWIPVDSKSCPECGAVFAGLEKEKKGYIERMKVQYAEYVDQYRDEAKGDLGSGMTDEAFSEWWKASPKYVGFEDWLSREEELKKGRTKNCPSCNTVNPESAAICFKCGTVFRKEEEEIVEEARPPQRPPSEVPAKRVSKPAERQAQPPTVVPKKVVRPPEVVPKKVVKKPPTVVPKKVVKRPPPEE